MILTDYLWERVSIVVLLCFFASPVVNGIPVTNFTCSTRIRPLSDIPREYIKISRERFGVCEFDLTKSDLRYRNMCPYVTIRNVDQNRVPPVVWEQRCCEPEETIFSPGTESYHCKGEMDIFSLKVSALRICQPVIDHRVYIRKCGSAGGKDQCCYVREPVQVGCSCSYQRVEYSSGSGSSGERPTPAQ